VPQHALLERGDLVAQRPCAHGADLLAELTVLERQGVGARGDDRGRDDVGRLVHRVVGQLARAGWQVQVLGRVELAGLADHEPVHAFLGPGRGGVGPFLVAVGAGAGEAAVVGVALGLVSGGGVGVVQHTPLVEPTSQIRARQDHVAGVLALGGDTTRPSTSFEVGAPFRLSAPVGLEWP
jgi:hypothetical protein